MCESQIFRIPIGSGGIRPDPERVEPIINYTVPKTKKQLRRFLGMVGWYSRFIEKESEIKLPFLALLKKSLPWRWDEEQQLAFEQLKLALTNPSSREIVF